VDLLIIRLGFVFSLGEVNTFKDQADLKELSSKCSEEGLAFLEEAINLN
jgi:hypothetical protein